MIAQIGGIMSYPVLYRKRIIPDECILLKDDQILQCDDNTIVTAWKAIHPRSDLSHGYSIYYLKRGYKISKFYRADSSLMYWYCDIVDYQKGPEENSVLTLDLLADVVIYPDGKIRILDLDELAEAFEKQLIDEKQLRQALTSLGDLMDAIYENSISALEAPIIKALAAKVLDQ
jgi:predicted RNA-binding protein associated with RNAse of E/G family